jgi:hypothetical protein
MPRPFRTALLTVVLKTQTFEMPNKVDIENDVTLEVYRIGNYQVYMHRRRNEGFEKAIVKQISAKHLKTSEGQETVADDTIEGERFANLHARKCIAKLRLHFMQQGKENLCFKIIFSFEISNMR